jgi:hypothetical protein
MGHYVELTFGKHYTPSKCICLQVDMVQHLKDLTLCS